MKKQEELFVLIKSLSKSEKRYFKLYCTHSNGTSSKYLKLFNAIDHQEIYNEQIIKKQLKGEAFIHQLPVTKNYLSALILKCLRNYHCNLSKEAELKDILRNIEILYKRELFKHCQNEVKRAKKIATNYEIDTSLVEILSWERKIVQALTPTNFVTIANIVKEQKETAQRLMNTIDYWDLTTSLSNSFGNNDTNKFNEHHLLKDQDAALTVHSKVLYHHSLYYMNLQSGKGSIAEQALKGLISYLESKTTFLKEDPGIYIATVNNYVTFLIFNKRFKEAENRLLSVKTFIDQTKNINSNKILQKQIFRTYNIELEIIKDQKEFNISKLEETENFVFDNESKIPIDYLLSFWFQLSSIFFENQEYSKALKWINKLMQFQPKHARPDLLIHGRMLNLLLHFELKNYFALGYFIDSTKRFINKNSEMENYQKLLFSFLLKASKLNKKERRQSIIKLKESFFSDDNSIVISNEVLDYIDYKSWIHNNL